VLVEVVMVSDEIPYILCLRYASPAVVRVASHVVHEVGMVQQVQVV
jgi:hypothetical protein